MKSKRSATSYLGVLALAAAATMSGAGGAVAAEQHVVLYSANGDTVNSMIAEGFKKATGITVNIVSTGSGVLFRRVASEHKNPKADVVWGVSSTLLNQNSKYFEPYAAKDSKSIPADFRDPDNKWVGTNLQVVVIAQNTKAASSSDSPKTWEDLLNPKWKGDIAYTDPANSGFSYAIATALISKWGNDKQAWDKFSKLVANAHILNRSTLVFNGTGSGEYPLGISLEYAAHLWAHNGAPVKAIYPQDGTIALVEGAAMIKGAPDPDNAKKLIDYLAAKSTQTALLKATFRRPSRQDIDLSTVTKGMPNLSDVKLFPYDADKWAADRSDTLVRLRDAIQNTR